MRRTQRPTPGSLPRPPRLAELRWVGWFCAGAWSVHGLHECTGDVAGHLRAEDGGVGAGEAEVKAGVDPGVFHLLDRGGERLEVPLDAGQPGRGDGERGGVAVEG